MNDQPVVPPDPPSMTTIARPLKSRFRRRVIALSTILICTGLLIYGACSILFSLKEEVGKAQCASNLQNIAAALVNYSNSHNGQYPDTIDELYLSSGMSAAVMVCPASGETVAEGSSSQQAAEFSAGRHISYIYLARGLTSQSDETTALAYDRPTNHGGNGMNVLFGDYHVHFLKKEEMKKFLAQVDSGVRPVKWPLPGK